jgi:hypothetical protein
MNQKQAVNVRIHFGLPQPVIVTVLLYCVVAVAGGIVLSAALCLNVLCLPIENEKS